MSSQTDDVVVGAGIVGLAVAYHLARQGRRVVVFERQSQAEGASVRNFGMIWPVGQPSGPRRDLAMRSRDIWIDVLTRAALWHEQAGSIHLAYHDDELRVLEEFAHDARASGFPCELIGAQGVAARAPRARRDGLRGALWSPHEVVVDPRVVVGQLPRFLEAECGVRFEFGVLVTACEGDRVETSTGQWRAGRVFLCSGAELQMLFPSQLSALGLVPCKLQMMRTRPVGWRLGPMLAAGLTLRHYGAFAACPGQTALRQRFDSELPLHVRLGIHVMASQNGVGELTLGDSHEYGEGIEPFDKPEIDGLVLDYLGGFLDVSDVEISSRWHGMYVKHPTDPFCVVRPRSNVTALVGFGGAGMTLAFGAAEQVVGARPAHAVV